ncbi:hypothetical protein [Texcoconibacillus texcoconensis]|uniref:Uncharacterized protein n=1 Tax=Texcoconibacillus texcoconensis TaxID=1095777 RepID=A0A840QT52_9BACI|nr:hypothetical protein [Texcoconibacillus texcoconensis]MBB5174545.1 hypothetical protein [Texcoconibacillus texcoconensis]
MVARKVYEPSYYDSELVTSYDQVVQNVQQFNADLENETDIVTQLTQFTHWYYFPELDMYGPSKFIGYQNMNTSRYARGKGKTGVHTEEQLKQWFEKLPKESEQAQNLLDDLSNRLSVYEKRVRSNAQIHIRKKL